MMTLSLEILNFFSFLHDRAQKYNILVLSVVLVQRMTHLGLALDVKDLKPDTFMEMITITMQEETLFHDKLAKIFKQQDRVNVQCVAMDEVTVG